MAETPLPPLDKVDPAQAWKPWEPDDKQSWDLKWAGHLHRRAAFGAPLDLLREAVRRGLPDTLDQLLRCDPKDPAYRAHEVSHFTGPNALGMTLANAGAHPLRGWWLHCMVHTPQPFREKMTLFWHNHFATSVTKPGLNPVMMFYQNRLLREHALGKFGPFLLAISQDPAMLLWLDSNSNVKGKPNENYAREVMELFSLGVGNYTEKDVLEAARAFTGWHTDGNKFDFNANQHDDGEKMVLGHTGNWNGDDIVRICLEQPVCARFLVRKLYRYFISEMADPPDALLEPLADSFRKSDYDITALMRRMLGSRHFFSAYAYRKRIKSPVEFVLGAVHDVLYLVAPKMDAEARKKAGFVVPKEMIRRVDALGQQLFAPPNVKGWEHGRSWLNTATVLARHNFAQLLTSGSGRANLDESPGGSGPLGPAIDPATAVRQLQLSEPDKILTLLTEALFQGDVNTPARAKLLAFLSEGKPEGNALDNRVREAVHAMMTMPEYQLA